MASRTHDMPAEVQIWPGLVVGCCWDSVSSNQSGSCMSRGMLGGE